MVSSSDESGPNLRIYGNKTRLRRDGPKRSSSAFLSLFWAVAPTGMIKGEEGFFFVLYEGPTISVHRSHSFPSALLRRKGFGRTGRWSSDRRRKTLLEPLRIRFHRARRGANCILYRPFLHFSIRLIDELGGFSYRDAKTSLKKVLEVHSSVCQSFRPSVSAFVRLSIGTAPSE